MKINYNIEMSNEAIAANLKKLINQTYKLLPDREENIDWETPLQTIIEEFSGMTRIMPIRYQEIIFSILCKLEGLHSYTQEESFSSYRRTIFECLNLIQTLKIGIEEAK